MFCDGVAELDAAERARYADLLVLIAAADGELVREEIQVLEGFMGRACLLYTSPSPRDRQKSRMPSSA